MEQNQAGQQITSSRKPSCPITEPCCCFQKVIQVPVTQYSTIGAAGDQTRSYSLHTPLGRQCHGRCSEWALLRNTWHSEGPVTKSASVRGNFVVEHMHRLQPQFLHCSQNTGQTLASLGMRLSETPEQLPTSSLLWRLTLGMGALWSALMGDTPGSPIKSITHWALLNCLSSLQLFSPSRQSKPQGGLFKVLPTGRAFPLSHPPGQMALWVPQQPMSNWCRQSQAFPLLPE